MSTDLYSALTILVSLLPLTVLALRDPKRLRSLRQRQPGAQSRERRILAAVTLLPGLILIALGQWPAFLIWSGFITVAGWLLALWLARGPAAELR